MGAVVLVSGGMDSVCVAALAKQEQQDLAFLHVTYGQNTAAKEKECFLKICDHYQIPQHRRKIVDISYLKEFGGSSLTDDSIEVSEYNENASSEIPSSYVPFRNSNILAISVAWAEVLGFDRIYIGANEEDSPGYPDCRPAYYQAFNRLIQEGTKEGNIKIITPVIADQKTEIIKKAQALNAPLHLTWSCYLREDKACGKCDSCALRLNAFKKLGQEDPIEYQELGE